MKDGFIKVAAASPRVKVADCAHNTKEIKKAIEDAHVRDVAVLVLPEMCVTAYTCEDLFLQTALQKAALSSLFEIAAHTKNRNMLVVAGLPVQHKNRLYNAAAVLYGGEILGFVPKSYPPNYGEFQEQRYFDGAPEDNTIIILRGKEYPFGTKLLFCCAEIENFAVAVEICEDLFAAVSPSAAHSIAGATIIANPSASTELIGKVNYRRNLVSMQSAKNIGGYIYCNAGQGESTTDLVFSAHNIIAEDGEILEECMPFRKAYAETEIDVDRLAAERVRLTSTRKIDCVCGYQTIKFSIKPKQTVLSRTISASPFIPLNDREKDERCSEILNMQVAGLRKRLEVADIEKVVIGVSGGSDSTLALLVACGTMNDMKRRAANVIAISMPCFGTTERTRSNAKNLCNLLGATFREIDITRVVKRHLKDIDHSEKPDTAFENAQARERTQVLMDVANMENGLVIGTGDLSEAALGWSTYNGDHMSMYNVNCGVPKTLVKHIIKYTADNSAAKLQNVLLDILDTPVSPELLPNDTEKIIQKTEEIIGPYELHDFFLYYMIRWAFEPAKIRRLAIYAYDNKYSEAEITKWLKVFLKRFFTQQFKRSCVPNGPKVGSVGLSPRGDWRMPSDASYDVWIKQLD